MSKITLVWHLIRSSERHFATLNCKKTKMFGCVVQNCHTCRDKPGNIFSLHAFPKKLWLKNLWFYCCRRTDPFNPNNVRICCKQFSPRSYERDLQFEIIRDLEKIFLNKMLFPLFFFFNCQQETEKEWLGFV